MSVEFSAKISMLRKEKNISQKQAAADLQISQALLSHYEKGIRECNLDFVKRCASYYGVSADFLLGLTEGKEGANELSFFSALESDKEICTKTLLRALIGLSDKAKSYSPDAEHFFHDFFSICIKQYAALVTSDIDNLLPMIDLARDLLVSEKRKDRRNTQDLSDANKALGTVEGHAKGLISAILQNAAFKIQT